jgi:hypothetical protein
VPTSDVRQLLTAFEHAYNCLLIFLSATEPGAPKVEWYPDPYFGIERSESMVFRSDRLVLAAARLASPGFWEFLGSQNPLEIIRKYLQDRHERLKDRRYKTGFEAQRLGLENVRLETDIIEKRIEVAKRNGAPEHVIASLLDQLVYDPLDGIGALQDGGLFTLEASQSGGLAHPATTRPKPKSRRLLPPPHRARA